MKIWKQNCYDFKRINVILNVIDVFNVSSSTVDFMSLLKYFWCNADKCSVFEKTKNKIARWHIWYIAQLQYWWNKCRVKQNTALIAFYLYKGIDL